MNGLRPHWELRLTKPLRKLPQFCGADVFLATEKN